MQKRTYTFILHRLLLLGVVSTLTSCKRTLSDRFPSDVTKTEHQGEDSDALQPVRIIAEVQGRPASARANGTFTGTDLGEFNPLYLADHDYERRIYAASLYVLKHLPSDDPEIKRFKNVKRILYVTPEFAKTDLYRAGFDYDSNKGEWTTYKFDEVYTFGDPSGKFKINSNGYLEMEFEVKPGDYTILMSANGGSFDLARDRMLFYSSSEIIVSVSKGPDLLTSGDGYPTMFPVFDLLGDAFKSDYVSAFTTRDYKPQPTTGISNYLIPMSGYAHITVLPGVGVSGSGDATPEPTVDTDGTTPYGGSKEPQVAHIMLERVQARIDVTLTTADADLKDYLHSDGSDATAKYRPEDWKLNKMLFWVPRGANNASNFLPAPREYSYYTQKYPNEDTFVSVFPHKSTSEKSAVAFLRKRPMWDMYEEEHLIEYYDAVGRTYAYMKGGSKNQYTEPIDQIAMTPDQMVTAGINLPNGGLAKMYKRSIIMDTSDEGKSYQEASMYVPTQLTLPVNDYYTYLFVPQNSPRWPATGEYFGVVTDVDALRKKVIDAYTELFVNGKFSMSEVPSPDDGTISFDRTSSNNSTWGLKYDDPLKDAVSSISFIALEFARVGADMTRLETDAAYRDANVLNYMVPIVNDKSLDEGNFRSEPEQFFSLRRNTVYQFDLTFTGSKLVVTTADISYEVDPWKEKPVIFPVFD